MKKIRILLLEDSPEDVMHFKQVLPQHHFEIAGVAAGIDEGIALYEALDIDIVIIDIFLKGKPKGIEFAHRIRKSFIQKPFLFLTSSIEKEVFQKAKATEPYSYLIKPFNGPEVLFAMELALENFVQLEGAFENRLPVCYNDSFFIRDGNALTKVTINELLCVTVEGTYCHLVTQNGSFILQTALSKFLEALPKGSFLRTHRNVVVNLEKIQKIYPEDNLILLENGVQLPLSRRYKEAFFKTYQVYK